MKQFVPLIYSLRKLLIQFVEMENLIYKLNILENLGLLNKLRISIYKCVKLKFTLKIPFWISFFGV